MTARPEQAFTFRTDASVFSSAFGRFAHRKNWKEPAGCSGSKQARRWGVHLIYVNSTARHRLDGGLPCKLVDAGDAGAAQPFINVKFEEPRSNDVLR